MTTTIETPTIRPRDVFASETTKIITHPATLLAIALAFAANTLFGIVGASAVQFGTASGTQSLAEFPSVMFAPIYAFLVLPVYAAASEYQGGQLRMSLTATPDRNRLVLCKLAALTLVVLPGALLALIPARLILGFHDRLTVTDLLTDIGRWTAAYLLMSLVAFGLATVLRSAIAPLSLLGALAVFVNAGFLPWPEGLRFLPDQAAMNMLGTPSSEVTVLPPAIGALAVGLWALIAIGGHAIALTRRDS